MLQSTCCAETQPADEIAQRSIAVATDGYAKKNRTAHTRLAQGGGLEAWRTPSTGQPHDSAAWGKRGVAAPIMM
jgi:hypothetical protein